MTRASVQNMGDLEKVNKVSSLDISVGQSHLQISPKLAPSMINKTKLSVYTSTYKLKKRLLRFYHLVIITNFKGTKFVFKQLHSYLQVCLLKKIQKVSK